MTTYSSNYRTYAKLKPDEQKSVKLQEISVLLTAYLFGPKDLLPSDIMADIDMLAKRRHPNADHDLSADAWKRVIHRVSRKLNTYMENDLSSSPTQYSDRYVFNYTAKSYSDYLASNKSKLHQ